jgi:hypothetical protein
MGAPLLGTLEDTLRKALDTGIALHRGPFMSQGNLVSGGGLIYRGLGKMNVGGSRNGVSFYDGFHGGDLERGLLYMGPRKIR